MTNPADFDKTTRDVLHLLTAAQDRLMTAVPGCAGQRQGQQNALRLISATKAELRKTTNIQVNI